MLFHPNTGEYLLLDTITNDNEMLLQEKIEDGICMLWSTSEGNHLLVDDISYDISTNRILFLTDFHMVKPLSIESLRLIRFNRSFYCIRDHDREVGCKGLLFFGASQVPIISILQMDEDIFNMLWEMFLYEMETQDNLQYEMLQVMLKRFIILCTRTYKMGMEFSMNTGEMDLFREFNYLVEMNYKALHSVAEYASLLYKSPKTLSNLFAQLNRPSPLQVIQDRIVLEARRYLRYTEKPIKEIAYDLGFEDTQSFSRLFKRKVGKSPSEHRTDFLGGS